MFARQFVTSKCLKMSRKYTVSMPQRL